MTLHAPENEAIFTREGNFAVFNQLGVKLVFDPKVDKAEWYDWLDDMTARVGTLVPGAEIAEKSYARAQPRLNTGVYYDTDDYRLLRSGAVLRTTCNKITHAFCAFKLAEDDNSVRKDHRFVFEGDEKATIQEAPTSPQSAAIVHQLLNRDDIEHPGVHLREIFGIQGDELSHSICLEQYRHPFFVWLDKQDALRCSMDRVQVSDLRKPEEQRVKMPYGEIELPFYPRVKPEIARDPRVVDLITVLSESLRERFAVERTTDNKYERAATVLGVDGRG